MKIFFKKTTCLLPVFLLITTIFFGVKTVNASTYYYFKEPAANATFKVGEKVTVSFYAGVTRSKTSFDAWGQPSTVTYETMPVTLKAFKGDKEIYSNELSYTKATTISTTYTPNTAGTIKLCIYGRNIGLNSDAQVLQDSLTIKVKSAKASAVKKVKPRISVERTAKKSAEISCNENYGYGMKIYRSAKKNGKYKLIKTTTKSIFTDKKLAASKVYFYKVRLYAKSGKKTYLSKWSSKVKAAKYKAGDITLSYSKAKGVKVSWKKIKGAGYYLVGRKTDANEHCYEIISCESNTTTTYYDKKVEKGKTYYYAIFAEKGDAEKVGEFMSNKYKIKIS